MTAKQKSEDEIRAELRQQEQDRKTGISSLFQKFGGSQELLNKCLSDDTIDHSRAMELLMTDQLGGGQGPATDHSMGGSYRAYGTSSDFMEAASDVIAMRGGVRVADPHPSAAAGDFERMSLTDIAASCLRQRGQSTDRMTKDQVLKAALSTSDFPLILSNTANKSIAQGYAEAPAVHPALCSSREAADFKPQTLLRLSAFDSLLELGEQSEFQHADLLESAESFKIDTYGRTINISRQALVNDELSMFSTLPAEMGAAARRMESSLYWEMLTSNGGAGPIMSSGDSFFHANHGNIATGADLSTTALAEMKKLMRVQKSLGGRTYLNIQPSFLVVPPSLEQTAEEVLNSTLLPTSNVETVSWIRSLTLLVAPELEDIDPAAYYLFSAPEQLAATSMAYLQGHQSPTVEGNDEWERLASSWRVFFDFAAVAVEPAGAVYNGGSGAQAARKKKA